MRAVRQLVRLSSQKRSGHDGRPLVSALTDAMLLSCCVNRDKFEYGNANWTWLLIVVCAVTSFNANRHAYTLSPSHVQDKF